MNRLDRLFLRIARTSHWKMQRTAQDGQSNERSMARVCLRLMASDYNKNHGEGGRFASSGGGGGGGSSGGSSGKSSGGESEKKAEGNGGSSSQPSGRSNYSSLPSGTRKHADEMSNAVSSGKAKVRESGMKAHMPNTPEYREHAALHTKKTGYMPSHFDGDYKQHVPTIQKALKDRNAVYKGLKGGEVSAKIDLGTHVGTVYGRNDNKGHSAHAVEVRYSPGKKDWHFYPCDMEDD